MGWPKRNPNSKALGGFTFSVVIRLREMEIIEIPSASTALWISHTDRLQVPQAGARNTASAPSPFSIPVTSASSHPPVGERWRIR